MTMKTVKSVVAEWFTAARRAMIAARPTLARLSYAQQYVSQH
jgi:hypothetical protein